MKKYLFASLSILVMCVHAGAVPAFPGRIQIKGPGGANTQVIIHGDEYCHWATDTQGREVRISQDGTVTPLPAVRSASRNYSRKRSAYTPYVSPMTKGNNHFLVILVQFADRTFTLDSPKERFTRLLNDDSYSDFGGTGSAHKYYHEQSSGQFDPIFDVVGPVTVGGAVADYGGNENDEDKNPTAAFVDAVSIVHNNGLANFADYDADGDGYVDNIFFYYAGHNEAEGGGDDCIWPHAFGFYGANSATYDGVRLGRYACTSELKGSGGETMCGIGTFCHEFGHVLGLPDFYDTDYEKNGTAETVYAFSLMCAGNYNNGGCSPPNLGAMERYMLGWMDFPQEWTTAGDKEIKPITENEAFRLASTVEGEFFLLEVRDATGWDSYIQGSPKGTLIYHVDQSDSYVGGTTALSRWNTGSGINEFGSHPCYRIIPASKERQYAGYTFPGYFGKTEFSSSSDPSNKDYGGGYAGFELSGIAFDGQKATMHLEFSSARILKGKVTDSSGEPMAGVTVSISDSSPASAPKLVPGVLGSRKAAQLAAALATCTTDSEGNYSIEIPGSAENPLTADYSKPYYNPVSVSFSLLSGTMVKNVSMRNVTETAKEDLQKYEGSSGYAIGYQQNPQSVSAAVRFSSEELAGYVGMRITDISFLFYSEGGVEEASVFVDFGLDRQISRTVDRPVINRTSSQNIADANIRIPEGADVFVGYALKNVEYNYPLAIGDNEGVEGGGYAAPVYLFKPEALSDWEELEKYNICLSVRLEPVNSVFPALGIKIIANPGKYVAGDSFALRFSESNGETPVSTVWYFDSEAQSESSVTLTSGRHEVKAVCTYADGSTEEIVQIIQVQ